MKLIVTITWFESKSLMLIYYVNSYSWLTWLQDFYILGIQVSPNEVDELCPAIQYNDLFKF